DGRDRIGRALPGDVGGGAVNGFEHGRVSAGGVDVAGRRGPDAPGHRGGQVGDDVTEEVVGDDHVEPGRVGDHVDGRGIDVAVVHLDVRELRRHLVDGALPESARVDQ